MYFNPKIAWPPATYDVNNWPSLTITLWRQQLIITELVSKSAQGINEQLMKTSGSDVLFSRKKLRKTLWGGGEWSDIHSPHPPRPS